MTTADLQTIRGIVERGFSKAPFFVHLGAELVDCGPGFCDARIPVQPHFLQHTGSVHAGVVSTLADHCAGVAAMTMAPAEAAVLTVEFKINLLRPAKGQGLLCRAKVVKPGRNFSIAESEVFAESEGSEPLLVAKLLGTFAVVMPK